MTRRTMTGIALALGLMGPAAEAQGPGRAYKVAFWLDLDRPLSTLRHQAYDLAKGEYDEAAVARWRRTIFEQHPTYTAFIRDISTIGEPGENEAERLANAIDREQRRWTGPISRVAVPSPGPISRSKFGVANRPGLDRSSPGSPAPTTNLPGSPFPYPYRSGPR